ncbi:MAG: FliI/YscN family ATPase [Albidovulum sp.]
MGHAALDMLRAEIAACRATRPLARVTEVGRGLLRITGTGTGGGSDWCIGGRVVINGAGCRIGGEIVTLDATGAGVLTDQPPEGIRLGDSVTQTGAGGLAPHDGWIGRIIDPFGQPLDGAPLMKGGQERDLRAAPPPPAARRRLGARLETGMRVFNTMLPLVRGQRIGLFAGSGVGKSSLLATFARHVEADVTVIALIGERGRELREFVEDVLGPEGMARSVVIAATSDQSPLVRRRCAWAAMAAAEYFRDQGKQVLFLADSVTRLAEAHREVALAAGEPPSLRGYPPSTSHLIMSLAERAGPGPEGAGDITAVFSVLVAGSDMDEPIADILRGVLDGHVVMDRDIAERGRYPAINLLRSVSRSLPWSATEAENELIAKARKLLGAYDRAEMMIQAGLYTAGSDPLIDAAIKVWPELDAFLAEVEPDSRSQSFLRLAEVLEKAPIKAV